MSPDSVDGALGESADAVGAGVLEIVVGVRGAGRGFRGGGRPVGGGCTGAAMASTNIETGRDATAGGVEVLAGAAVGTRGAGVGFRGGGRVAERSCAGAATGELSVDIETGRDATAGGVEALTGVVEADELPVEMEAVR